MQTDEIHYLLCARRKPNLKVNQKNAVATLSSQRGKGLAGILLQYLEKETANKGITNLYTIARSRSFGINMVFKKAGYKKTGKLANNCFICGNFENMTIWSKII